MIHYRLNNLKEHMNRETWLNDLATLMAPRFEELGHPLPKFHVAIGFPSSGKSGNASAECWHSSRSADKAFQIFIRPDQDDTMMIAGDLAHELTHAAVGFTCGHKGDFAKVVLAFGLNRPLTATTPGEAFKLYAQPLIDKLGPIPHARLTWPGSRGFTGSVRAAPLDGELASDEPPAGDGQGSSNAKKKQTTRMLKATCKECAYTVRLSKKWASELGAQCPKHGGMTTEGLDAAEGGESED